MNTSQTLEQLKSLKLNGMYEHYAQIAQMPTHEIPDTHELIAMLAQSEMLSRTNRKTQIYVKQAGFRYQATMEGIDYLPQRMLNKNQIQALSSCSFINKGENLILTGATGCGKSYIATALAYKACSMGYKALYVNMPKLADASKGKYISKLAKTQLLVLDDFGLSPMTQRLRMAMLQIMEDRYERKSIIITSQLPFSTWYDYIGEPTGRCNNGQTGRFC